MVWAAVYKTQKLWPVDWDICLRLASTVHPKRTTRVVSRMVAPTNFMFLILSSGLVLSHRSAGTLYRQFDWLIWRCNCHQKCQLPRIIAFVFSGQY